MHRISMFIILALAPLTRKPCAFSRAHRSLPEREGIGDLHRRRTS
jgi:hypothetical protein